MNIKIIQHWLQCGDYVISPEGITFRITAVLWKKFRLQNFEKSITLEATYKDLLSYEFVK